MMQVIGEVSTAGTDGTTTTSTPRREGFKYVIALVSTKESRQRDRIKDLNRRIRNSFIRYD